MNLEASVFAGVAAILAVQPSIYRAWKQLFDQIITNSLGATFSLFFLYFFGDNPVSIGLVIMLLISLSIKMKMESTIPLTLITVLAIMSASGSEDLLFALERFATILIGTGFGIIVNHVVLPPNYQKDYIRRVQSTFQSLSLLLRTAISNEMTETSFQEQRKKLKDDLEKLENNYKLFDEERAKIGKIGKGNMLHAREIIVFKQMCKTLQEGDQLLENIEEHYFQTRSTEEENELFDHSLEELIKFHEHVLLHYQGKVKEAQLEEQNDLLKHSETFYEKVLNLYNQNKQQKLRLLIIASSIVDYTFHLHRLNEVVSQYRKLKE